MRKTLFFALLVFIFSCSKEAVETDVDDTDTTGTTTVEYAHYIEQYGITWAFDTVYEYGQYANGDYWIVGPVELVGISNSYHTEGFTPTSGQDGSMINPGTDANQGYDNSLSSYDESLNVNYPNGAIISEDNTLTLNVNESLISTVSWLYNSETDTETDCPSFNAGTNTPRPVLRTAAVLTCVSEAPTDGSFRPPYCGSDKSASFNSNQLKTELLPDLAVPDLTVVPDVEATQRKFQRIWIDHVYEWKGSYLHPSDNMSHYGQNLSKDIGNCALLLNLDFTGLDGSPIKDTLIIELVQLGIDFAGIADNGGSWPPNGGFLMGRKFPILFAGVLLGDDHMTEVGSWSTLFQEDGATFYVSQDEIDITNSDSWDPDSRIDDPEPYETSDIGLPEWGIRHITQPQKDVRSWDAPYRSINGSSYCAFVLAAHMLDLKSTWNHDPLFDFTDRWYELTGGAYASQTITDFTESMWTNYRSDYQPVWTAE